MILRKLTILFFCLLFFSCQTKREKAVESTTKINNLEKRFGQEKTFVVSEPISASAKTKINSWSAYFDLAAFLSNNYLRVSSRQSLEMSNELLEKVNATRDLARVPVLNTKAVSARLNVLRSEVLRLKDMANITSITPDEVFRQTEKLLNVFSALNSKINTVFSQENFDEQVNFDESIFEFDEK